jgi:DNA-binding transcriptional MerR regulator
MRIGELARRTGASARSLRYYERQGLLQARRQPNGYREYDDTELTLVREIRSLLDSGFDLEEIRPFVECLRSGILARQACPGAVQVYQRKLAQLDGYVGRLQLLRDRVANELRQLTAVQGRLPDAPTFEEVEVQGAPPHAPRG